MNLLIRAPLTSEETTPVALGLLKAFTPEVKCLDLFKYNKEIMDILTKVKVPINYPMYHSAYRGDTLGSYFFYDGILKNKNNKVFKKMIEEILYYEPNIVGFSVNVSNIVISNIIAKELHKKGIKTVFGGCSTQFVWKELKKFKHIDSIVVGEGELAWKDIIENHNFKKVIFSEKIDLDSLPIPDYSDLDLEKYNTIGLETQRGCINRCAFCSNRFSPSKEEYREKSIGNIRKELRKYKKYNKSFRFCDNITNPNKERLIDICKMTSDENITWFSELLPRIDEEEAYWLKRGGCLLASFGIETFSESCRRKMNKPTTNKEIIGTLKNLKKYNIPVHGMFFMGFPTENIFEALENILKMMKYSKYFKSMAMGPFVLTPNNLVSRYPEKYKIKILPEKRKDKFMHHISYYPRKPYLKVLHEFIVKYTEDKVGWWTF